jgi:PII-like signaling protein
MKGFQLVFSTLQSRKHPNGERLSHWLVEVAEKIGIKGVTILQATQGIGRDGKLHSSTFFELADEPLEIIMNVSEEECEKLFELLSEEKLGLFYTKTAIEYGTI